MPSTSRTNKGLAAGAHSKHTKESHKIAWGKVDHGKPKVKKLQGDWWNRILANQADAAKKEPAQ